MTLRDSAQKLHDEMTEHVLKCKVHARTWSAIMNAWTDATGQRIYDFLSNLHQTDYARLMNIWNAPGAQWEGPFVEDMPEYKKLRRARKGVRDRVMNYRKAVAHATKETQTTEKSGS